MMKHLEPLARDIMRRHQLKMMTIADEKALGKYILAEHSTHQLTFGRNGREKWGPELKHDYMDYKLDHKEELLKDYPLDRLYWLVAFRHWYGSGFQEVNKSTWLCWYLTLRGNPYPDCPVQLNWKTLLYQLWLEQSKKWRESFKKDFLKEYPEGRALDIFAAPASPGDTWQNWRLYAFRHGLEQTEMLWRGEALLDLEHLASLV
jgi:hypothetical protein